VLVALGAGTAVGTKVLPVLGIMAGVEQDASIILAIINTGKILRNSGFI
jgi:hypothetical protein